MAAIAVTAVCAIVPTVAAIPTTAVQQQLPPISFSPENAAIATLALNSALCCFLFTLTLSGPVGLSLIPLSKNSRAAALPTERGLDIS
jgi:hypothetical protein